MAAEAIRANTLHRITLEGYAVQCRFVRSKVAKKLRIKIRPDEIEVVVPEARRNQEGLAFVVKNKTWVVDQMVRARQLRTVRRPDKQMKGQVLFRGMPYKIKVVRVDNWLAQNKVTIEDGKICIMCGADPQTPASRSLENWLRNQARVTIAKQLADIGQQKKLTPNRVYIMGQRTKWGNCSALRNLSFNWRLIMAPDFVLRYIVTHEMVHLSIPDHSAKFWLTVKSLCKEADSARAWLSAHGKALIEEKIIF